jgi:hypothetical protein
MPETFRNRAIALPPQTDKEGRFQRSHSTDGHVAEEMRELIEGPCDALITDLHVWRVGPAAHAAIVSVTGVRDGGRLGPVHELVHLTIEVR